MEQFFWWDLEGGTSRIWFDNLNNVGPLFKFHTDTQTFHEMKDIYCWNFLKMHGRVPNYVVDHIRYNMNTTKLLCKWDYSWWTLNSSGAWDLCRSKGDIYD